MDMMAPPPKSNSDMLMHILQAVNEIKDHISDVRENVAGVKQYTVQLHEHSVQIHDHVVAVDTRLQKTLVALFEGNHEEAAIVVRLTKLESAIKEIKAFCITCGFSTFKSKAVGWGVKIIGGAVVAVLVSVAFLLIAHPVVFKAVADFFKK